MGFNALGKISVYHIHVLYEYVYILDAANAHLYVCFHSLHKKENNVFLFLDKDFSEQTFYRELSRRG